MKPSGYPLPWCEKLDLPYYQINLQLCFSVPGWGERQAYKPMSEIIPWIDELLKD